MLLTKAALLLLVAVLGVSCTDDMRVNENVPPRLAPFKPSSIYNDNNRYPKPSKPLSIIDRPRDGPRQLPSKPKISFGSVTIQEGNTYTVDPDSSNFYGSITKLDCKPGMPSSHTPTSSDSENRRVPGTTVDEETRAILIQNHREVMDAINFLKRELRFVKEDLYVLKMSDATMKRDLERVIGLSN